MDSSINSLLNQRLAVKTQAAMPAHLQRQLITATVINNSSLLESRNSRGQTKNVNVTLESGTQRYELSSPTPLPSGTRVELKWISATQAQILAIHLAKPTSQQNPTAATTPAAKANLNSSTSVQGSPNPDRAVATFQPGSPAPLLSTVSAQAIAQLLQSKNALQLTPSQPPGSNQPTGAVAGTEAPLAASQNRQAGLFANTQQGADDDYRKVLEQTLRLLVPQQQASRELFPLVQTLLPALLQAQQQATGARSNPGTNNNGGDKLALQALATGLKRLSNTLANPQQLQQPAQLRHHINNSGVFLESRLALLQQQPENRGTSNAETALLANDLKAQMNRLLAQVFQLLPSSTDHAASPLNKALPSQDALAILLQTMAPQMDSSQLQSELSAGKNPDANLDVLLRQLGRQLLATLARTQLNQLESLLLRQPTAQEPQPPTNSWLLDIPIQQGKQTDNLQLRIDEQAAGSTEQDKKAKKQWRLTLSFDLHQLGKMQVKLALQDKEVSASVWSEERQTHYLVNRYIEDLSQGLESAGIAVKQLECHWGQAPTQKSLLSQQLVDLHT